MRPRHNHYWLSVLEFLYLIDPEWDEDELVWVNVRGWRVGR